MEKFMTTQRVQLDISNDIFDKVMFFLENLPKNKVKLNFENILSSPKNQKDENNSIFSDFLNNSQEVNSFTHFGRDALHER